MFYNCMDRYRCDFTQSPPIMGAYRPYETLPSADHLFDPLLIYAFTRSQREDLLMHRLTLLAPLLQALILRRRILQGDIGQFEMDQPFPPL